MESEHVSAHELSQRRSWTDLTGLRVLVGPALPEVVGRQLVVAACPSWQGLMQEPEQAVEIGLKAVLQLRGL